MQVIRTTAASICWRAKCAWFEKVAPAPKYFALSPILLGLICIYLLMVGQMQEIYMRMLESQAYLKFVSGVLMTTLLGLLLFVSYIALTRRGTLSNSGEDEYTDEHKSALACRDWCAAAVGLMPIASLFAGLIFMHWALVKRSLTYLNATRGLAETRDATEAVAGLDSIQDIDTKLTEIHTALAVFIVIAAIPIVPACYFYLKRKMHWLRNAAWFAAIVVAIITTIYFPLLDEQTLVLQTRIVGPLAMAIMQIITILVIVVGLIKLSQTLQIPIIFFLCLAIVGRAMVPSLLQPQQPTSLPPVVAAGSPSELSNSFQHWLRARRELLPRAGTSDPQFPVYIVAAQGGGIYAATAAATFLSHLHDRVPSLPNHLFTMSAVSGGAVGSALYSAFAERCTTRTENVRRVLEEDHLSPVLGLLVAEYAEKALLGLSIRNAAALVRWLIGADAGTYSTRASALQASLELDASNGADCRGALLARPYGEGWRESDAALILNTTHAETGERVTFAPFPLRDVGQGSLSSFRDFDYWKLLSRFEHARGNRLVTLSEAAVTSARFPGLMPALHLGTKKGQINFVDGGYADNSGVATGAAILDALSKALHSSAFRDAFPGIDLSKISPKMIAITDSERPRQDLDQVSGTSLVDLIAPVLTILNVRSQISAREVFLAADRYNAGAATSAERKIRLIQLDGDFTLELGWTFSKSTNDVVSLMVARPEFCRNSLPKAGLGKNKRAANLMWENACVVKGMIDELEANRP